MRSMIAVVSTVAMLMAFASPLSAQSAPTANSASALQGLQEQSFKLPPTSTEDVSTVAGSPSTADPNTDQVVLNQLDARTQLVFSPARDDRRLQDVSSAGQTGNNQVQVIYGFEQ